MTLIIDGDSLKIEDIVRVARKFEKVKLSKNAIGKIKKSRVVVEDITNKGKIVYGITTGFGSLCNVFISKEKTKKLQKNLIRSHSCGVGRELGEEIVRATMLLRANTLAKGFSGIKVETVEKLIKMLNKEVHPVVPEKGSVGASGDLAPLSHIALVLIGEGEAIYKEIRMNGKKALELAEIKSIELDYKEGLALNNGTQLMTAIGALTVYDSLQLIKNAEISSAMSLEALKGISSPFNEKVHIARKQIGQIICAENIRKLIEGSKLINSNKNKVHDSYCLRCIPQVLGACRDTIEFVKKIVEREINAVTDNPIIFSDTKKAISAGNYHGEPIALVMDFLKIALSEIGNIAERRIAKLMDKNHNEGLPSFLIKNEGMNSGLMLAQYTSASLVSENKVLAHPASVDSIPTSANQEDHVSMGTISARNAREILENVEYIIAIEFLCSAQALEFRKRVKFGKGTEVAYKTIRKYVKPLDEDRVLAGDIEKLRELVKNGEILREVEKVAGKLK